MLRTQLPAYGVGGLESTRQLHLWTASSHPCRRSAVTVNLTGNDPVDGLLLRLALLL